MSALVDGRGCLTETGLAALAAAAPGQAPADLALHVAACHRCQQRALFGNQPPRPGVTRKPHLGYILAILFGGLIVTLAALVTLRYLNTPP